MLLLISVLSTVYGIYRSAVNIITYRHAAVCKFGVAVNAEDIRACREMSVTPSPARFRLTNAPAAVAIAAEICGVWHNFCVCIL